MTSEERTPAQRWVDNGDRQGVVDGLAASRDAGIQDKALQKADALVQLAIFDTLSQILAVQREILAGLRLHRTLHVVSEEERTRIRCEVEGHRFQREPADRTENTAVQHRCVRCGVVL